MTVKPGDILRDRLRVDALIGRGGMGQVFAATDLESRAQVAIKVVSRLLVDDVLMVRLHREAEAAQRIRSEFVPRVLEVSDTDEGETFLVMERLVGEPLSQRIRDRGALSWNEVHRLGEDVLCGLVDAHAAGIVHRDLKPSNVFLALKSSRVRAMVLDFGVCKMDGVDAERLTGTGESIGTVAYMAPEQIRGAARVDARADLFAFGVLVFEMLSGRLPHEGPSQMAILASKLENAPARLTECSRVPIPEGVDALVTRALERDPAKRFANAWDLLEVWRALPRLGDAPIPAPSVRPFDGAAPIGADPPTEVSRPPAELLALSSDATNEELLLDPTYVPPLSLSSRRASLSLEPHPTQTALTTHHTSIHQKSGAGRLALVLAACGLVAGIVVVGVSFARGPDEPSDGVGTLGVSPPEAASLGVSAPGRPASLGVSPPGPALSEPPGVALPGDVSGGAEPAFAPSSEGLGAADEGAASDASDTALLELPADPPASGAARASKPKPSRSRARPPASKSGGPRITTQPRY
ncbi:MAG: protein kinase [Labilithrix sp.]|nr:protein kinase [Labilithrix sp.]